MVDDAQNLQVMAVEETVHSIAQRVHALDARLRNLIVYDEDGGAGVQRASLYQIFQWRLRQGDFNLDSLGNLTEVVLREVERFRALINNLLGFYSREEPLRPRKRPERLRIILEEVVDLFEFLALEKGIDIHLLMADDPLIKMDRDLVQRLFINLCDNAVKYSFRTAGGGGKRFISIVCKRHTLEGDYMITISSYGVGILEEEISSGYVFHYGTRGSLARDRERRGLGIGLAESKRIAESHGGTLRVTSVHQHGDTYLTSVQVVLPAS